MQRSCNIVFFKNLPIFQQLTYEEALLRANSLNWCIINQGSPPACVLGISNNPEEHLNTSVAAVPIIRRFSGGGSVVVDSNTFFLTLILNNERNTRDPQEILKTTFSIISPAFFPLNFRHMESDYTVDNKKVAGNAIYISKTRILHHSTFLFDFDPTLMEVLHLPPSEPEYRKKRPHALFLANLKSYFATMDLMQEKLYSALQTHFSLIEKKETDLQEIAALPHRKALTMLYI